MQNAELLYPQKILVVEVEFYRCPCAVSLQYVGDNLLLSGRHRTVAAPHVVVVAFAEVMRQIATDVLHVAIGHGEHRLLEASRHPHLLCAAKVGAGVALLRLRRLGIDAPERSIVRAAGLVSQVAETALSRGTARCHAAAKVIRDLLVCHGVITKG